jgi:hypothetical protein
MQVANLEHTLITFRTSAERRIAELQVCNHWDRLLMTMVNGAITTRICCRLSFPVKSDVVPKGLRRRHRSLLIFL